ncbi:MAG: polysulfide reductase NrfD [Duodenibacillus sp.]|nr:polysulfide reductase NrfD [Duodenibacillus sp.]
MESSMNFTLGLTQGVQWPWPIAVYLFLAGISGGAVAIAMVMNLYKGRTVSSPLEKAASLIGFIAICLGMVCLVADLTNPLYFWRILVFYNPTSVMSIGVMALLVYIPLTFILVLVAFSDKIKGLPLFGPVGAWFAARRTGLSWVALLFAVTICAYTGFLISALVRYPLINTAVLPALFVASGLSAGAAGSKLLAVGCFGDDMHSGDMHVLHNAEWPIMAAEALCIFMIAMAMVLGNAGCQMAAAAFVQGTWATVFWIGVVGVGFAMPVLLGFMRQSAGTFLLSGLCSVAGMMCLRLFILYAGQMYTF